METGSIFLSVLSIWGFAVLTPGPNFFLTVQTAMARSRVAAFYNVCGIITGTFIWATAGFLGLTAIFHLFPWAYLFIKILGGTYLIYLGIKNIKSASRADDTVFGKANGSSHLWRQNFFKGVATNLSNPKTAIFISSLFAAIIPSHPTLILGISCVAEMLMISFVWYSLVALFFSWPRIRDFYRMSYRWIKRITGVLFIGFGAKLALDR